MKILALEFSSSCRSIALAEEREGILHILAEQHEPFTKTSSVASIHQLLKSGWTEAIAPAHLELICLGLGPGSYTGIRSSISIAQGFELAQGVKILGVSSMEILASQLALDRCEGDFHLVVDAQKKEVYHQQVLVKNGSWKFLGPLKIVPLAALMEIPAGQLVGPEADYLIHGAQKIEAKASTLARFCLHRKDWTEGEKLEPIYLREVSFVKAPAPRLFI